MASYSAMTSLRAELARQRSQLVVPPTGLIPKALQIFRVRCHLLRRRLEIRWPELQQM